MLSSAATLLANCAEAVLRRASSTSAPTPEKASDVRTSSSARAAAARASTVSAIPKVARGTPSEARRRAPTLRRRAPLRLGEKRRRLSPATRQERRAGSGFNLWSEQYDREMTDVFAMQDDITRSIVGALRVQLRTADCDAIQARPAKSIQAYESYLKGLCPAAAGTGAHGCRSVLLGRHRRRLHVCLGVRGALCRADHECLLGVSLGN
jgi:hypothetical protein